MAVVADEVAFCRRNVVVEQRDGCLGDEGPVAEDAQAALVRQQVSDGLGEGVGEEAGREITREGDWPTERGRECGERGAPQEATASKGTM